jgi:hypothetical protein
MAGPKCGGLEKTSQRALDDRDDKAIALTHKGGCPTKTHWLCDKLIKSARADFCVIASHLEFVIRRAVGFSLGGGSWCGSYRSEH